MTRFLQIELQVDRLWQVVEKKFDVACDWRVALPLGNFDIRPEDAAPARVVRTFLRPVDLSAIGIDGDSHAPFRRVVAGTRVALARIDEGFDL